MKTTFDISEFPAALQDLIGTMLPVLGLELSKAVMLHLHRNIVAASPVGDPATDPHPGKYRASNAVSHGAPRFVDLPDLPSYMIPSDPDALAGMDGATPGESLYVATDARSDGAERGYSDILEAGRRQYSRVKTHTTLWAGSTQANTGVYEPALETTAGQRVTIEAAAIKATEERIGG